jgi:hypothetical protein
MSLILNKRGVRVDQTNSNTVNNKNNFLNKTVAGMQIGDDY